MKIKSEEDSWNYWFFNGEEEFKNSLQARGKGEDWGELEEGNLGRAV